MHPETKKLGEMLVEAGLITVAQLNEALRFQKASGGRMGSNLVATGMLSEESMMDFLAQQTGVPRMDVRHLDVPPSVLERIPRRLAEQMTILPVAFKEPKSMVLAMADPSDLNAVDSARFASGLNIEPVVAAHSALRLAISDQYRKLENANMGVTIEVPRMPLDESLPVTFEIPALIVEKPLPPRPGFPRDPFFDALPFQGAPLAPPPAVIPGPFSFFAEPPEPKVTDSGSLIIHARSAKSEQVRPLESFQTRTLVLGLTTLLQRRGILGSDELQRFLINQIEAGELSDSANT